MAHQELTFKITGVSPLVLHNGRTANPLDFYAKEMKKLTSKRKKTDADYEQLAKLEWYAGLYTMDGKVVIPADLLEAAFINGAKKFKMGKQSQISMFVPAHSPLIFDGDDLPIDELYAKHLTDGLFSVPVRIGTAKTIRTRPRFDVWSVQVTLNFDEDGIDESMMKQIVVKTGTDVGLGDWRPRYGRFAVEW